jgi:hypothetical protein
MNLDSLESAILFVADLDEARAFHVGLLGLSVLFEDDILSVVGRGTARPVLYRNDRGHDERGIFPNGAGPLATKDRAPGQRLVPSSAEYNGSRWAFT